MGPEKLMRMRGAVWKPSSWLISCTSWQSLGAVVQSGMGRFTRKPDFWVPSSTVRKSVGKGPMVGSAGFHTTVTPLAKSSGAHKEIESKIATRRMVFSIQHHPGGVAALTQDHRRARAAQQHSQRAARDHALHRSFMPLALLLQDEGNQRDPLCYPPTDKQPVPKAELHR